VRGRKCNARSGLECRKYKELEEFGERVRARVHSCGAGLRWAVSLFGLVLFGSVSVDDTHHQGLAICGECLNTKTSL
jgi:hypothetical protein